MHSSLSSMLNLKGSLSPTIVELPSVNLVCHDSKLQHGRALHIKHGMPTENSENSSFKFPLLLETHSFGPTLTMLLQIRFKTVYKANQCSA